MEYQLAAIKIGHREDTATAVQEILTGFGCHIKVRLGLHDLPDDACAPAGLLVLQVDADEEDLADFLDELNALEDVTARSLTI